MSKQLDLEFDTALKGPLRRNPGCKLCPLHKTAQHVCLLGSGGTKRRVMAVGEAPGENEDGSGKVFVGKAGRLLDEVLDEVGLPREEIYVTNAVHCRPHDNRKPKKKEIAACSAWLEAEFRHVKPKYVLLLGSTPLQAIKGPDCKITQERGRPFEKDGIVYFPSFHPSYCLHDPRQEPTFRADLGTFAELVNTGKIERAADLRLKIVRTWADLEACLKDAARCGDISYDLETTGLYPWQGEIVSVGIGTDRHQWVVPLHHHEWSWPKNTHRKVIDKLDDVLSTCLITAHYGKFDSLWAKVKYGVEWDVDFDTGLAHYNLDENAKHGLKELSIQFLGARDYDVPLEIKQGKKGTLAEHAEYLGLDVLYTRQLKPIFKKKLQSDPATYRLFLKLTMPVARMFVDIEYDGVYVDQKRFGDAEKYLNSEIAAADKKLAKAVKPYLKPGEEINWKSPQQIADLLFNRIGLDPLDLTGGGAPSTSESVLKRLATEHEIPALIIKRRGAQQQLSFFIEGWKPYLVDGYLHPSFKLSGTVTGRPSCENPNLQQVPRDSLIRSLITAPEGWTLIEIDLSQIEMRIAAELSGDDELLRCFNEGIDVHWRTAMNELFRGQGMVAEIKDTARKLKGRTLGYSEAVDALLEAGPEKCQKVWDGWKEVRKKAKAVNFGYLFGMWWKKFIIYARDQYDVIVTEKQAQESRENYFSTYRGLVDWHKRQRTFARRNGYVRSLIGRKRRLPDAQREDESYEKGEAERQAINSPVQGFASDMNLMILLALRKEFKRDVFRPCGTVHDAILARVKKGWEERVITRALEIARLIPMLKDAFDVELTVPIEADAKVGPWSKGVGLADFLASRNERVRV